MAYVDEITDMGNSVQEEGLLQRKYEWESTQKRSVKRSWKSVYCILVDGKLSCYKDQKHLKIDPQKHINNEGSIDLFGAECHVASDYGNRPFVLRLILFNGGEYLFQAESRDERDMWVSRLNKAIISGGLLV